MGKENVRLQMKGKHMFLFFWSFMAIFVPFCFNEGFKLFASSADGVSITIVSLLLKMVFIMFVNTIYFLFLMRIRNKKNYKDMISISMMQWKVHLISGFMLAIVEMALLMFVSFLVFIPTVYTFVLLFVQIGLIFVKTSAAYAIYDGNMNAFDVFRGSFLLVGKEAKTFVQEGNVYIGCYMLVMLLITVVVNVLLKSDLIAAETMMNMLMHWGSSIVMMVLQGIVLAYLFLVSANIYENKGKQYFHLFNYAR